MRLFAVLSCLSLGAIVLVAQSGPVPAMYDDDQKRAKTLAPSFYRTTLPPAGQAGGSLQVYLSAGDLERAFDRAEFRPDAAIVPTNTDLLVTAANPATQRVLVDRVQKNPDVMRDLDEQIAARKKQTPAASAKSGILQIGTDAFVAQLPRGAATPSSGAFPKTACLIATDYAGGGAVDRRELFTQDRVRRGVAACLGALDAAGARSIAMPLLGASSSETQSKDPVYEGQRLLKECRLLNAVAGIALGIHDFAPGRRNVRDIGVVQWDQEITGMFSVGAASKLAKSAELAYKTYAEQIRQALQNGLAGKKLTPGDVGGNCNATFNAR